MILQPTATVQTEAHLCGLSLARETERLLAWDADQRLYLWDLDGKSLGRQSLPTPLAAAQIADDGQHILAAFRNGQLWWFNGRLQFLYEQVLDFEPLAVALEAFGQWLAISDRHRRTHLLSANGVQEKVLETPKALRHLAFVASEPRFFGAADVGLLASFDSSGARLWQQVVVSSIGSITVDGAGETLWAACYTDGIRRFDMQGRECAVLRTQGSCRLVCSDYDGTVLLAGEEPARLSLLKSDGAVLGSYAMPRNAAHLVLDALGERGAFAPAQGPITLFALAR
jgi:hypothetical protein